MNVTDIINKDTIEAFELFSKSVEIANKKTTNIAIKKICDELETEFFYMESAQKKQKFREKYKKVKNKINQECNLIITDWFEEFVL
tara:strand:+ start:11095 stop:11352 length:258 start_codon:yes stop_codon:yes gene_type:complete